MATGQVSSPMKQLSVKEVRSHPGQLKARRRDQTRKEAEKKEKEKIGL